MKKWIAGLSGMLLLGSFCAAEKTEALKNEKDRVNYSVGYQMGGDFKRQGVELDPEVLVRGIQDALAEKQPLLAREEMRQTLVDLKKRILASQEAESASRAEAFREEGRRFMAENAKKEGVVTLPSGLQYRIIEEGTGRKPNLKDMVTVHYRGKKIDGTEFENSYDNGESARFSLYRALPAWQEVVPMMKEGAKWQLFAPADLAFGERGPLANQTVIFEIELLEVQPQKSKI